MQMNRIPGFTKIHDLWILQNFYGSTGIIREVRLGT